MFMMTLISWSPLFDLENHDDADKSVPSVRPYLPSQFFYADVDIHVDLDVDVEDGVIIQDDLDFDVHDDADKLVPSVRPCLPSHFFYVDVDMTVCQMFKKVESVCQQKSDAL